MPKGYKNESPSKILTKHRRSDQIPMGSNRQGKSINNAGKIAYSALQITRKMG